MNPTQAFTAVFFCIAALASPVASAQERSRSLFLSRSAWETLAGEKVTIAKLSGHPTVVAMIYSGCQASCPLMMLDLKAIENGLPAEARKRARFAVFAIDSGRDQPEKLKAFAETHRVDPARWMFFHGSPSSVRELAALLGVRFKQIENGAFDHSNMITILDSGGAIAHQQAGLRQNPEESIKVLRKLALAEELPR